LKSIRDGRHQKIDLPISIATFWPLGAAMPRAFLMPRCRAENPPLGGLGPGTRQNRWSISHPPRPLLSLITKII